MKWFSGSIHMLLTEVVVIKPLSNTFETDIVTSVKSICI